MLHGDSVGQAALLRRPVPSCVALSRSACGPCLRAGGASFCQATQMQGRKTRGQPAKGHKRQTVRAAGEDGRARRTCAGVAPPRSAQLPRTAQAQRAERCVPPSVPSDPAGWVSPCGAHPSCVFVVFDVLHENVLPQPFQVGRVVCRQPTGSKEGLQTCGVPELGRRARRCFTHRMHAREHAYTHPHTRARAPRQARCWRE